MLKGNNSLSVLKTICFQIIFQIPQYICLNLQQFMYSFKCQFQSAKVEKEEQFQFESWTLFYAFRSPIKFNMTKKIYNQLIDINYWSYKFKIVTSSSII
ncbi:hypothetical protein pb186bvf_015647 [Paramecium bursaria]